MTFVSKNYQCRTKMQRIFVLQWTLERSQARIGNNIIKDMRKKNGIKVPRRTKRLDSRATPEEYNTVKENAKKCGLTISDYMRKCALSHKPKLHLTEREIEAYCSLADARGDLIHIRSALKGKSQEQIKHYFNNERFMRSWIDAVTNIILQWDMIVEEMKE